MSALTAASQTEPEAKPRRYWLDNQRFLAGAMLLPTVIYIVLLVGVPFVLAILYSFSDATTGHPQIDTFTLDTFKRVTANPTFQRSLLNTFIFTFFSQLAVLILANILALALYRGFRGKWLVRLMILLPWATPIAITSIVWQWILEPSYSPIDWIFRQIGLLNLVIQPDPNSPAIQLIHQGILRQELKMNWLGEEGLAMFSVIVVHVWRMLPMSTVILLAGHTSIPTDVRDAVEVDGVGFWRSYFQVTLPLLRPIMLVALLFGIIFTFTDMTIVHVLTRGNAGTQVLSSWAYYQAVESPDLAGGAATAIFMLPVLVGVAALMLRTARRSEVR